MTDSIKLLPLEIVFHILSYLPFESLLSFGETSRSNYEYHIFSLKGLRLGVFEKRIHSVISLLQAGWASLDQIADSGGNTDNGTHYTISVIQPKPQLVKQDLSLKCPFRAVDVRRYTVPRPDRGRTQEQVIRLQNRIFTKVLSRYGRTLTKLEFMAYDLDLDGARALGTKCQHSLRHLALRFEHPHIRDGPMRPSTWLHPAPGSGVWNLLVGSGKYRHMGLSSLETLILERAGITPWQLMMLVKNNPNLKVLKLRTCRGAQPEFLNWLGAIESDLDEPKARRLDHVAPGAKLEVLWLEHCHQLLPHPIEQHCVNLPNEVCDYGLEWVRSLKNLRSLSFSESANLPPEFVYRANKTIWGIPEVILPWSLDTGNTSIEVDPRWL